MPYVCPNAIVIRLPDGIHNNYGIEVQALEAVDAQRFVSLFYETFDKSWRWFFQGGSYDPNGTETWKYFEFWIEMTPRHHDLLLEKAMMMADELGLGLDIR